MMRELVYRANYDWRPSVPRQKRKKKLSQGRAVNNPNANAVRAEKDLACKWMNEANGGTVECVEWIEWNHNHAFAFLFFVIFIYFLYFT